MSKKDILTDQARNDIKNPNFSPKGEPMPIGDNDVTDATNDISSDGRDRLAFYLGAKTSKNKYFVSPEEELKERPHVRGNSVTKPSESQEYFTKNNPGAAQTFKSEGFFFEPSQITDVISKNASDSTKSGHDLLNHVPEVKNTKAKLDHSIAPPEGNDTGSAILRHVHEQLVANNMYNPDVGKPFLANVGGANEEEITRGIFSIQRDLGSFNVNGKRVQVSDMSAMALAMLMRATGNDEAAKAALEKDLGKIGFESVLKIVLRAPQTGRGALGIENYRLSSLANLKGNVSDIASKATGQDPFIINIASSDSLFDRWNPPSNSGLPPLQSTPRNAGSYAQMNTFMEPFSVGTRFSSTGMFTMALASTAVMIVAGLAIEFIAGLVSASNDAGNLKNPASLALGRHKPNGASVGALVKLFNITRTDYGLAESVGAGIKLLYGISNDDLGTTSELSDPATALVIAENLILAGGFYANFTRRMIASALNVASSFAKLGKISLNPQGVEAVLKGIEDLLDSMVYKFLMVAAGIGDASLRSKYGMIDVGTDQRILPYDVASSQKFTVTGSLGTYRRQIYRWGKDSTNSLSLKTFIASQRYDSNITAPAGNRNISPSRDQVQAIEDALESEYMPFYIHDLRTHEVMSMPAFITEFGETFNANYNSVEGIGRQDPVRLYQKTERGVTFGFMLVSYNEEDQDHMWWTINKLVAMCYPQYSKGRIRTGDNGGKPYKFIQPFSQVQAASPMVRLRLGDVFKSNYSKFGLARLFGANQNLNSSADVIAKQDELKKGEATARENVKDEFDKLLKENANILITTNSPKASGATKYKIVVNSGVNPKKENGSSFAPPAAGTTIPVFEANKAYPVKRLIRGTERNGFIPVAFLIDVNGQDVRVDGTDVKLSEEYIKDAVAANESVKKLQDELNTLKNGADFPTTFYSDAEGAAGNAIVRSFQSTRGRGVAGFITSLSLDYGMGSHPWGTEFGKRAPFVVKISLGFTPITDLPLGLDYDGNLRNPSHPVGKLAGGFGDPYFSLDSEELDIVKPASLGNVKSKIAQKSGAGNAVTKIADDLNKSYKKMRI